MKNTVLIQRLEGLAIFLSATTVYFYNDLSVLWFVVLLFAFDVFMIGYIVNNRLGALLYNIGHTLVAPSLLIAVYLFWSSDVLLGLMCLWFAHIGIDRALGYGLKSPEGFEHTHLGIIGRRKS